MAAPAFGAAGTQFQGSPGTTVSVDVPDGVVANSIIVLTAFVDSPTATITALPAGFANAADSPVVGASNRLYVAWKRATGSESTAGTYDYTTSASVYNNAQAIRYDGAITTGDPWDVTNSAVADTSGTVSPAVSDTSTVADILWVFAATNWAGGSWTPPGSYAERRDSGDGVCTVADLAQAVAGASGSITATCTGSDRRTAWLGALKSEVAAAASEGAARGRMVLPGRINVDGRVHLPSLHLDEGGVVTGTSAPAGSAEGTGTAPQPVVAIGPSAGQASASGSAPQPTATVKPNAGNATATGSALQPTIAIGASPGVASATGTAPQPAVAEGVPAGVASATGSASPPSIQLRANAGVAAGVGDAPQPSVTTSGGTSAPAGLASASGAALQPTVAIGANAGGASATGAAPAASVQIRPSAGVASGTGSAPQPVVALRVNAGVASGTGTANQPTVTVSGAANAPAGLAAATGTALQPTVALRVNAGVASATGLAGQPTVTTSAAANAPAGLAAAVGAALQPTVALRVNAGVASATGEAFGVAVVVPVTPAERIYEVAAELRTFTVDAEQRVLEVEDDRVLVVVGESRVLTVDAEERVMEIE